MPKAEGGRRAMAGSGGLWRAQPEPVHLLHASVHVLGRVPIRAMPFDRKPALLNVGVPSSSPRTLPSLRPNCVPRVEAKPGNK